MFNTTPCRLSGCAVILALTVACTPKTQVDDNAPSATTAQPSSAATGGDAVPEHVQSDTGMHERDPAKAIERHLSELKRLVPGIQGVYVDAKDASIVLDVYAPKADTNALENHRSAAERLLGHPVRINPLASQIVQQPGVDETK